MSALTYIFEQLYITYPWLLSTPLRPPYGYLHRETSAEENACLSCNSTLTLSDPNSTIFAEMHRTVDNR